MWDVKTSQKAYPHGGRTLTSMVSMTLATLGTVWLTGCEVSSEEQSQINGAFEPGSGGLQAPPARCEYQRFTQAEATVDKRLDLLFLVDTSGSLDVERSDIANGIDAFIGALPGDVQLQVGVMLAHGSTSTWAGRLFRKNTEPIVLSNSNLTTAQIRTHLHTKLASPPSDFFSDGGESGFYSLHRALTDPARLAEIQGQGFFREGAAFSLIMVSDENDICAIYPAGVTRVFDGDHLELTAQTNLCGSGANYLTAEKLYQEIRDVKGSDPLVIAGLIYNNLSTVPAGGENEFGYGWSDLIRVANGISVNLANGHYQEGLQNIGLLATVKLDLRKEFELTETQADPGTVQVFVDAEPVPFSFTAPNIVNLTGYAGIQRSEVEVQYCLRPSHPKVTQLCQDGSFAVKPQIKLGLVTDPAEGSSALISNGLTTLGFPPISYTDAQMLNGDLLSDGITLLVLARKVSLQSMSLGVIDALKDYIAAGGSVLAEFDGAALFFSDYQGSLPIIQNMNPSIALFSGEVSGGGALIPVGSSRTYVTNGLHPIMQGLPADFLVGLRTAFAIYNYDGEWLESLASFTSSGTNQQVPPGTYPAVLAGRCGTGRVVLVTMNHLQALTLSPVNTMISNAIHWATGR